MGVSVYMKLFAYMGQWNLNGTLEVDSQVEWLHGIVSSVQRSKSPVFHLYGDLAYNHCRRYLHSLIQCTMPHMRKKNTMDIDEESGILLKRHEMILNSSSIQALTTTDSNHWPR